VGGAVRCRRRRNVTLTDKSPGVRGVNAAKFHATYGSKLAGGAAEALDKHHWVPQAAHTTRVATRSNRSRFQRSYGAY
jgi:hypothetical protein